MDVKRNLIMREGRCVDAGAHEIFFSERPDELAAAQALCAECSVRIKCLELAVESRHEWGVWGGVIFWDGQPYHRRRGRGRPRHSEAQLPVEASWDELEDVVKSA